MSTSKDNITYDVRTVRHLIRRGVTSGKEYASHLDGLSDEAEQCDPSEVQFATPYATRHYEEASEPVEEVDTSPAD
jgi:hypothetical protein